jgi:hypothetical protein
MNKGDFSVKIIAKGEIIKWSAITLNIYINNIYVDYRTRISIYLFYVCVENSIATILINIYSL